MGVLEITPELQNFYNTLESQLNKEYAGYKGKISVFTFRSQNTGEYNTESDLDVILLTKKNIDKGKTNELRGNLVGQVNYVAGVSNFKRFKKVSIIPGSLEEYLRGEFHGGVPENIAELDGTDNLQGKILMHSMAHTGYHIFGENVVEKLQANKKIADPAPDPIQGYELFVAATRDLAIGFFGGDNKTNNLAKAILNAAYAMHLMAGRSFLKTYKEITDYAEYIFRSQSSKKLLDVVKKAYEIKTDKTGKKKFQWQVEGQEDLPTLVNAIFGSAKNLANSVAVENGLMYDGEKRRNLKYHFERRTLRDPNRGDKPDFIELLKNAAMSKEHKEMLTYYVDELVTYLRGDYHMLPVDFARQLGQETGKDAEFLVNEAINLFSDRIFRLDGVESPESAAAIRKRITLARLYLIKGDADKAESLLAPLVEKSNLEKLVKLAESGDSSLTFSALEASVPNLLGNLYRDLSEAYLLKGNQKLAFESALSATKRNPLDLINWEVLSKITKKAADEKEMRHHNLANYSINVLGKLFAGDIERLGHEQYDKWERDTLFSIVNPFLETYMRHETAETDSFAAKLFEKLKSQVKGLDKEEYNFKYVISNLAVREGSIIATMALHKQQQALLEALILNRDPESRLFSIYSGVMRDYPEFKRDANEILVSLAHIHSVFQKDRSDLNNAIEKRSIMNVAGYVLCGNLLKAMKANEKQGNSEAEKIELAKKKIKSVKNYYENLIKELEAKFNPVKIYGKTN